MSASGKIEAVRPDYLIRGQIAFERRHKRQAENAGFADSLQALGPKPNTIDVPPPFDMG
jgi:hypothetical protein